VKDDLLEKADTLAAAVGLVLRVGAYRLHTSQYELYGRTSPHTANTIKITYVFEKADHGYDTN